MPFPIILLSREYVFIHCVSQHFQEVVNRLKVFQRYSRQVRQKLSGLLYYESFETGRRIIQQGHQAKSFYFLLSGSAMVKSDEVDKKTGAYLFTYYLLENNLSFTVIPPSTLLLLCVEWAGTFKNPRSIQVNTRFATS